MLSYSTIPTAEATVSTYEAQLEAAALTRSLLIDRRRRNRECTRLLGEYVRAPFAGEHSTARQYPQPRPTGERGTVIQSLTRRVA